MPVSVLENQFKVFESMGLIVIYSCGALAPESKRRLAQLASTWLFDLSSLELPTGESDTVRKILSVLRPLRDVVENKD